MELDEILLYFLEGIHCVRVFVSIYYFWTVLSVRFPLSPGWLAGLAGWYLGGDLVPGRPAPGCLRPPDRPGPGADLLGPDCWSGRYY